MPSPADQSDSLLHLSAALQLDAVSGTFEMLAYDGGLLRVPNFALPVIVDLKGMQVAPQVKALLYHDPSRPAGHMTDVQIDQQIRTRGILSVPEAQAYLKAAQRRGFRWEASIGATIPRSAIQEIRAGQRVTVNGRSFTGPCFVARKSTLREASFTGFGAADQSYALLAASGGQPLQFQRAIDSMRKNQATKTTETQKTSDTQTSATQPPSTELQAAQTQATQTPSTQATEAQFPGAETMRSLIQTEIKAALGTSLPPLVQPIQEELDSLKRARITEEVDHLAAQFGVSDKTLLDDLKGKAAEGKIGSTEIELTILRASASRRAEGFIPAGRAGGAPANSEVLEAAYLLNAGWEEKELADHGDFDEKTINAACGLRGVGPHALAVEYLRGRGHHVMGGKLRDEDIRAAMDFAGDEQLRASGGTSTISLPGILSNVARKELLRGRSAVPSAITRIARRATATDYKPFYLYRLNTQGLLMQVGPDGELKSMELAEDNFSSRVYPWGRKLQMTEAMFINDDAGAFGDLARLFGRVSMLTLEKEGFRTLLSDQANFWTTAKGNRLASGSSSALSIESLKTAESLFLKFTDGTEDNNPIGVMPKFLLTGPSDYVTARTLNTSTTINVATGKDLTIREAVDNPFKGMFEPVMSPYLVQDRVPNATNTQWLLCADPAETAPIVVAYLDGRSTPRIQTWERIPGKLGMQWDISFRFGFNLHEDKAAVYSPGA